MTEFNLKLIELVSRKQAYHDGKSIVLHLTHFLTSSNKRNHLTFEWSWTNRFSSFSTVPCHHRRIFYRRQAGRLRVKTTERLESWRREVRRGYLLFCDFSDLPFLIFRLHQGCQIILFEQKSPRFIYYFCLISIV